MKTIGLIGGLSWEALPFVFRIFRARAAKLEREQNS